MNALNLKGPRITIGMDLGLSLTIWPFAFFFVGLPGLGAPLQVPQGGCGGDAGVVYEARSLKM